MKHESQIKWFRLASFFVVLTTLAIAVEPTRSRELFNANWRFIKSDVVGAEHADFDDAGWRKFDLPHDWGVEGAFNQDFPGETAKLPYWGVGWYRKHFSVPASERGKQFYLDVDGAMSNAKVWINGHDVGGWAYGYTSWRVDLTPHLRFDGENVIAIRLDNPPDSSRWYPGGGIYRNVWLTKTSPVHVAKWGTFVTTPQVTDSSATV